MPFADNGPLELERSLDLDERQDVLVGLVAADSDLTSSDRERLRTGDSALDFDEPEDATAVLRLDVIALVVWRHLHRVPDRDCVRPQERRQPLLALSLTVLGGVVENLAGGALA